ncbi:hypothetical protein BU26DRAFT_288461 [Trematosphaeria pertusa]|uniref:Uncharacterized protein n=1 Tax=Trematosphaeria pertusa TaxID=390896 RepID=A0A6A6IH32_9PLEO|nr:uncharacterized protein BU26DRAFT_288461 [Trematosphaeria pertusa]KAF2249726.1 hypothetical protein BU26DRAFT_288461 [Trematosphaeria pertusa]
MICSNGVLFLAVPSVRLGRHAARLAAGPERDSLLDVALGTSCPSSTTEGVRCVSLVARGAWRMSGRSATQQAGDQQRAPGLKRISRACRCLISRGLESRHLPLPPG